MRWSLHFDSVLLYCIIIELVIKDSPHNYFTVELTEMLSEELIRLLNPPLPQKKTEILSSMRSRDHKFVVFYKVKFHFTWVQTLQTACLSVGCRESLTLKFYLLWYNQLFFAQIAWSKKTKALDNGTKRWNSC